MGFIAGAAWNATVDPSGRVWQPFDFPPVFSVNAVFRGACQSEYASVSGRIDQQNRRARASGGSNRRRRGTIASLGCPIKMKGQDTERPAVARRWF